MNIDLNTGAIFEEGKAIFWKGMSEGDVISTTSAEMSGFLRKKRMSFYHLDTQLLMFGLIFSVSIIFQDSIIRKIELRLDNRCVNMRIAGCGAIQDPLGAEKIYFLKLLSEIENMEPNIVFLPEIGFRHKWGKIVVIENPKNFDCYILIEY